MVMVLITLTVIEGLGRIAYLIQYGEQYSVLNLAQGIEPIGQPRAMPVWMRKQILHPYYGSTLPNPTLAMNRAPKSSDKNFVVALFGGSVALESRLALQNHLEQYLRANNVEKELQLLLFAVPGFKQPQQLLQLSYALSIGYKFDLVINLDGYNEAVLAIGDNYNRGIYLFYPRLWDLRVKGNGKLEYARRDLESLRSDIVEIDRWYASTSLKYSVYSGFVYRMRVDSTQQKVREVNVGMSKLQPSGLEQKGPNERYESIEAASNAVVDNWYKSSLMMAKAAQNHGADYYHFLQPNQYFDDSKMLSAEEKGVGC